MDETEIATLAKALAQSTVSEHLRILKAAGLISGEIKGPRIYYAPDPVALVPLSAFLAHLATAPDGDCCVPTSKVTP